MTDKTVSQPGRGKNRRPGSFFGRRKGLKLRARKQRLIDNLLPKLLLDLEKPAPTNLADLYSGGSEKLNFRVEIGFGGGEHLAQQAEANQDIGFIGIEPFINGMAKLLGEVDDRELRNLRLYDEDAALVLDWLPAETISRVDLLYPDPWPKKRQLKRRFVSPQNLDRIARVLRPDGEFRFASDIESYVNWTLIHCRNHPQFQWVAESADDWRNPWENWHRTRYEAKAIREGRAPAYLVFKK